MPCITHETPAERAEAERRYQERLTGPLHREIDALKHRLAEREAMLCGVFRTLEKGVKVYPGTLDKDDNVRIDLHHVLAAVDWDEAGVTDATVMNWWEDHKRKDEERVAREAAALEAARAKALKKLTAEERKLLGVEG